MADILIRGISDAAKEQLAARAASNGNSQNAEARAILEAALAPAKRTWFDMLRDAAAEVGGVELPPPERHGFRETSFEWDGA